HHDQGRAGGFDAGVLDVRLPQRLRVRAHGVRQRAGVDPVPRGRRAHRSRAARGAEVRSLPGRMNTRFGTSRSARRIPAGWRVAGMVLSSSVVAYGFSRIRWRGRDAVFTLVLATMMIPFTVIMAPQYLLFKHLGWIGSLRPLWVPAWFGGAFSIFLLRQFFLGIPRELDEAAQIDGCSSWGTFWRVIVPLSRPALAVVALFHFIYVWNDFLAPLI